MTLRGRHWAALWLLAFLAAAWIVIARQDRKSTRLNSSHSQISYAVFCLKKNKNVVSKRMGMRVPVGSTTSPASALAGARDAIPPTIRKKVTLVRVPVMFPPLCQYDRSVV